jgi:hypothetical protein
MKFLKSLQNLFFGLLLLAWSSLLFAQTTLPTCKGKDIRQWHSCRGIIDEDEYSYAGDFMIGKFEGRGILEFTADRYQGDHYQGEFKNGLKHGFGMYFFANGDKYVGEYQFGKREGKGTYTFSNGKPALSGIWANNVLVTKMSNAQDGSKKVNDLQNPEFEKKKIEALKASILKDRGADKSESQPIKAIGKVRDAVAIVIGVQNYKNLPNANYASNDAIQFKDHAIRYLGVKPENVKLLTDNQAQRADILLAFKYWLPAHINAGKTDVIIYFSGHGLSQEQVKQRYFLPFDVNTDLLEETAINQKNLFKQISQVGARSVVVFLDTCFSGVNRGGQTLVQNQRAVNVKQAADALPVGFSVFSASSNQQVAYGDDSLQHGVFTFFLLKGISAEQGLHSTRQVNLGQLADYVTQKTRQFALNNNKQQDPKFTGNQQQLVVY